MPQYAALTYTADVDWSAPEHAADMAAYQRIRLNARRIDPRWRRAVPDCHRDDRPGHWRPWRRGGLSDGPYAETKEALTGFYLIEAADLDEALRIAADIPPRWDGAVEVPPVIDFGRERGRRAIGRDDPGRGYAHPGHPGPDRRRPAVAEDAVQEAAMRALRDWPVTGTPDSRGPG